VSQQNCEYAGGKVANANSCSPDPCIFTTSPEVVTGDVGSTLAGLVSCCVEGVCTRVSQQNCHYAGGTVANAHSCSPDPCAQTTAPTSSSAPSILLVTTTTTTATEFDLLANIVGGSETTTPTFWTALVAIASFVVMH
jgi:hypothetical protein